MELVAAQLSLTAMTKRIRFSQGS